MDFPWGSRGGAQAGSTACLCSMRLSSSGCTNRASSPGKGNSELRELVVKPEVGLSLQVEHGGLLLGFGEW